MEPIFGGFMVIWMIIAAVGYFFFFVNPDAAFKRKYFPWYAAFAGVVFGLFVLILAQGEQLVFVLPFLALIVFLQIRTIAFCDRCGRTIYPPNGFTRAAFCPHCGASLKPTGPSATQTVNDVMQIARKHAIEGGQICVGTGEILLALLSSPSEPAARALTTWGVTQPAVRAQLDKLVKPQERSDHDVASLTLPSVQRVLDRAEREASLRGLPTPSTAHLLLALIADEDNVATVMLRNLGVDLKLLTSTLTQQAGWSW